MDAKEGSEEDTEESCQGTAKGRKSYHTRTQSQEGGDGNAERELSGV